MFNGAVADVHADPAALRDALEGLRDNGLPWFFWEVPDTPPTHTGRAALCGADPFDDRAPWMEARTGDLGPPEVPEGVEVEDASDEASWRRWAGALCAIYEFPPAAEASWVEAAGRLGWSEVPWRAWTATRNGEAVGCTMMVEAGGLAGLVGVGVAPAARRAGIGSLMTLLPLAHTTEEWAGFFTTALGSPLYASLGFAEDGWITRWLGNFRGPPPEAARG